MLIGIFLVFGIVLGIILSAFDDGESFALFKNICCKIGWHKIYYKIGKIKINIYYCKFCKKPRKHPKLKVINGGKI